MYERCNDASWGTVENPSSTVEYAGVAQKKTSTIKVMPNVHQQIWRKDAAVVTENNCNSVATRPRLSHRNVVVNNISKRTVLASNTILMREVKRYHIIFGVADNVSNPTFDCALIRSMSKKR